ncbi:hypothetical protein OTB20_00975 [Streptomyces sp. H27-H1]|uniref:hypothetical protein n=1 Tax=Streptomyces sp. H27-H1 TaxID=2996461 RepID=UPI0022717465|nr:hypothetical protein [Streptomyces sp. H27-H1]MCY0924812.1 hypothetical protein [Streptomyces sp. H27-H1]
MNKKLAAAIQRDNELEDAGLHGDDRKTCWSHQSWSEDCQDQPFHTQPSVSHYPRPA